MRINFSNEEPVVDSRSVFLAGPTMRGVPYKKSWRYEACKSLSEIGFDGIVYVPMTENDVPYDLAPQANWERKCLLSAGVIVFNMCRIFPTNPGLTSNVEFGTYLAKKPRDIILCLPPDADKNKYIEWAYTTEMDELGLHYCIYRDLDSALIKAVAHLDYIRNHSPF